LKQVDVRTPLTEAINLPLAFENDLRTATLGEEAFGAGKGVRHMSPGRSHVATISVYAFVPHEDFAIVC